MYLVDSNILIYFLDGNKKIEVFFEKYKNSRFLISMVTRFEVLIGAEKSGMSLIGVENYLDLFENVNLDKLIVKEAINLSLKFRNKLKFKDLIIAATASVTQSTLVTADSDFNSLRGLKVKLLKISA